MNSTSTSITIFACLLGAVTVGRITRRYLPAHHLNAESKEAVRVAVGMIVTMAALLLGLLVASAKSSYDTDQSEVIQLGAKVAYLDRVLLAYGPGADDVRREFHVVVAQAIQHMWAEAGGVADRTAPNVHTGGLVFGLIERLSPADDVQRALKSQAASVAAEIGQLRTLLHAQSISSISRTMLAVVVAWMVVIFLSFSLLSPTNGTVTIAFLIAAVSVAAAFFLILELNRPFTGLIRISDQPLLQAITHSAPPATRGVN